MAWLLMRIVAMPTKRGQRSRAVREHPGRYDNLDYDNDNENVSFRQVRSFVFIYEPFFLRVNHPCRIPAF